MIAFSRRTRFSGRDKFQTAIFFAFFCTVLGVPGLAQATVYCIDDVSQVQSTLDTALASAQALEEVRIKQGNYLFTSGDIGYFGVLQGTEKTLWISGGWSGSPGQCTTQDGTSTSTLFWGLSQRKVFAINASTTFTGSIIVENMSFGAGYSDSGSTASCLSLGEQNGGVMGIRVDRVWFEQCTTAGGVAGTSVSLISSSALILRNSVVANSDSGGGVPITVLVRNGAGFVLNNTIANNTSGNINGFAGMSINATQGATMTMGNNLFDGNVATAHARIDVLVGTGVSMQNNRYTGLTGTPVANVGSSTGSAGFVSGSLNLAPHSTARDAGAFYASLLQGVLDAAGQQRVQGSAVDLGALEFNSLFRDSFE